MNTRRPIESISDDPAVLSVAFNNDASHFSVGLNTGFCSTYLPYYSPGSRRVSLPAEPAPSAHSRQQEQPGRLPSPPGALTGDPPSCHPHANMAASISDRLM